jgi:hypothetical protein
MRTLTRAVILALCMAGGTAAAETLSVRHSEGVVRGFLILKTLQGETIARGDLVQSGKGERVTSRLSLHFKDGSVHEENSVFTQKDRFRLVSDHLVQRGPTFPHPTDVKIDVPSGKVTVRYQEKPGEVKESDEKLELPEDLANGLPLTLVKNIPPDSAPVSVSMLFATPKPQLVRLIFSRDGKDSFTTGGATFSATRFRGHIEIGGIKGALAKLIGKQPPDASVWILEGEAPGYVRSESQLFQDGPVWRMELAAPSWR